MAIDELDIYPTQYTIVDLEEHLSRYDKNSPIKKTEKDSSFEKYIHILINNPTESGYITAIPHLHNAIKNNSQFAKIELAYLYAYGFEKPEAVSKNQGIVNLIETIDLPDVIEVFFGIYLDLYSEFETNFIMLNSRKGQSHLLKIKHFFVSPYSKEDITQLEVTIVRYYTCRYLYRHIEYIAEYIRDNLHLFPLFKPENQTSTWKSIKKFEESLLKLKPELVQKKSYHGEASIQDNYDETFSQEFQIRLEQEQQARIEVERENRDLKSQIAELQQQLKVNNSSENNYNEITLIRSSNLDVRQDDDVKSDQQITPPPMPPDSLSQHNSAEHTPDTNDVWAGEKESKAWAYLKDLERNIPDHIKEELANQELPENYDVWAGEKESKAWAYLKDLERNIPDHIKEELEEDKRNNQY